jgi:hypothetical protein
MRTSRNSKEPAATRNTCCTPPTKPASGGLRCVDGAGAAQRAFIRCRSQKITRRNRRTPTHAPRRNTRHARQQHAQLAQTRPRRRHARARAHARNHRRNHALYLAAHPRAHAPAGNNPARRQSHHVATAQARRRAHRQTHAAIAQRVRAHQPHLLPHQTTPQRHRKLDLTAGAQHAHPTHHVRRRPAHTAAHSQCNAVRRSRAPAAIGKSRLDYKALPL